MQDTRRSPHRTRNALSRSSQKASSSEPTGYVQLKSGIADLSFKEQQKRIQPEPPVPYHKNGGASTGGDVVQCAPSETLAEARENYSARKTKYSKVPSPKWWSNEEEEIKVVGGAGTLGTQPDQNDILEHFPQGGTVTRVVGVQKTEVDVRALEEALKIAEEFGAVVLQQPDGANLDVFLPNALLTATISSKEALSIVEEVGYIVITLPPGSLYDYELLVAMGSGFKRYMWSAKVPTLEEIRTGAPELTDAMASHIQLIIMQHHAVVLTGAIEKGQDPATTGAQLSGNLKKAFELVLQLGIINMASVMGGSYTKGASDMGIATLIDKQTETLGLSAGANATPSSKP